MFASYRMIKFQNTMTQISTNLQRFSNWKFRDAVSHASLYAAGTLLIWFSWFTVCSIIHAVMAPDCLVVIAVDCSTSAADAETVN